jgi:superfamily II DNA or RNA helicase
VSQALFEAVRKAATARAWSRGVELVRAGAVSREPGDAGLLLRVATRGGLSNPSVRLDDDAEAPEWDCDCGDAEDPCEHVAAAVIAVRRAQREGRELPGASETAGHIGYRLRRHGPGLGLERVVVQGSQETPLPAPLAAVASGRVEGPAFAATEADLALERALGELRWGRLPRGLLGPVIEALARCDDVKLDAEAVSAVSRPVRWQARVDDEGDGFRVRVVSETGLDEVFEGVAARCGSELRPLEAPPLDAREREALLGGGCRFEPERVAELVNELLPSLEGRLPLELRSRRLPEARREAPDVLVEVEREGDALAVRASVVYGSPARARLEAGRLVSLGAGPVPLRDPAAERALERRVQRELELPPGSRVLLRGADAVELAERLAGWRGLLRGEAHRAFFRAPPLEARFSADENGFEVEFAAPLTGRSRRADPLRVLAAWRAGESLVPLEGGGLAPLPGDWLARFGDRLADLLAAREATGGMPTALAPDAAALCEALEQPVAPALDALRERVERAGGVPAARLPRDLSARLRGYQRQGVDWLCALRDAELGALLADDMGLGKTLQALCALEGRCLVVAPTSVLPNWQHELARFRPGLRVSVYHGAGRALAADADVTLTSYAILRLDAQRLAEPAWSAVVLDEATAIKNPDSQVARAAFGLRARFRLALTGTPVENRLEELWSQLHFANPGLLGGRADFEERYARPIAAGETGAAERLRQRIRPFVLRRLKREVAPELPPRTEVVLHAELEPEERRLYEALRLSTRDDVVQRLRAGGSVLGALEALLRLRQAACHPGLVPGQRAQGSAKLTLLLERLEEAVAEGHKALVFSQWTALLDLLEPKLADAGLGFSRLDGSTRDRGGVVARFQAADGPPLLLVSLTAGGQGLNLTAADHVFLLDPWWNPAVEDQAADRAHRIGQRRPVMIHRLVSRNTVEERILSLQQRKRALWEAAFGGAGGGGLTREDLLALLD